MTHDPKPEAPTGDALRAYGPCGPPYGGCSCPGHDPKGPPLMHFVACCYPATIPAGTSEPGVQPKRLTWAMAGVGEPGALSVAQRLVEGWHRNYRSATGENIAMAIDSAIADARAAYSTFVAEKHAAEVARARLEGHEAGRAEGRQEGAIGALRAVHLVLMRLPVVGIATVPYLNALTACRSVVADAIARLASSTPPGGTGNATR